MRKAPKKNYMSFVLATLVACGGQAVEELDELPFGFEGSTINTLITEPALFQAEIQDSRDAWVAIHRGDLTEAVALSGEALANSRARAAAELSSLHYRLAQIQAEALVSLAETQSPTARGTALSLLSHIAIHEMSDAGFSYNFNLEGDYPWLTEALDSNVDHVSAAAVYLHPENQAIPVEDNPFLQRLSMHGEAIEARDTGSLQALYEAVRAPLWELGSIRLYDPQTHFTLGNIYQLEAEKHQVTGLSSALFSPCPNQISAQSSSNPNVLRNGDTCADQLIEIGLESGVVSAMLEGEDDLQTARTLVHHVDEVLDGWRNVALRTASPDGAALLTSLSLVENLRAKLLVSVAGNLLNLERPHQALAIAQATLDITNPREVSSTNPALLFAVLAHAQLRTGHTREALDALEVLSENFPSVITVDETVGDLAVVEGLHRIGDSKEL